MDTIRTEIDNIKITLSKSLFTLLEDAIENIEKKFFGNEVNIYYDDYTLNSIRITDRGFFVIYKNSKGDILDQGIKFKDLIEISK